MGYNYNDTVAGAAGRNKNNFGGIMGRRCGCNKNNIAGDFGRKDNDMVAGDFGRRRFDCDDVFECLLELLEDALEDMKCRCKDNNSGVSPVGRNIRRFDCEDVFQCLAELLADALEDDKCRKRRQ